MVYNLKIKGIQYGVIIRQIIVLFKKYQAIFLKDKYLRKLDSM